MCLAEKKEFVIGKMQIEKEGRRRRKRRRVSESSFCELPRVKLRERRNFRLRGTEDAEGSRQRKKEKRERIQLFC